jgi:hypothetical protein
MASRAHGQNSCPVRDLRRMGYQRLAALRRLSVVLHIELGFFGLPRHEN